MEKLNKEMDKMDKMNLQNTQTPAEAPTLVDAAATTRDLDASDTEHAATGAITPQHMRDFLELGQALRALRVASGKTAKEVAQSSWGSKSHDPLARIERGESKGGSSSSGGKVTAQGLRELKGKIEMLLAIYGVEDPQEWLRPWVHLFSNEAKNEGRGSGTKASNTKRMRDVGNLNDVRPWARGSDGSDGSGGSDDDVEAIGNVVVLELPSTNAAPGKGLMNGSDQDPETNRTNLEHPKDAPQEQPEEPALQSAESVDLANLAVDAQAATEPGPIATPAAPSVDINKASFSAFHNVANDAIDKGDKSDQNHWRQFPSVQARLTHLRCVLKLSAAELAQELVKAKCPTEERHVLAWERAERRPTLPQMEALAAMGQTTRGWIMTGQGAEPKAKAKGKMPEEIEGAC